jgi:hypothetical protein
VLVVCGAPAAPTRTTHQITDTAPVSTATPA